MANVSGFSVDGLRRDLRSELRRRRQQVGWLEVNISAAPTSTAAA